MRDKQVPFSISFVAFNENKNEGGEIIFLDKGIMCGLPYQSKQRIGIRQRDNNYHPFAVHQKLILEVNGQKVFY